MVSCACEKPSFCRTQSMLTGSMFFPAQDKNRTRGSSFQCLLRNWRILLASGLGAFSLSSFSVMRSLRTRAGGDIPRGMEPRKYRVETEVENSRPMDAIYTVPVIGLRVSKANIEGTHTVRKLTETSKNSFLLKKSHLQERRTPQDFTLKVKFNSKGSKNFTMPMKPLGFLI